MLHSVGSNSNVGLSALHQLLEAIANDCPEEMLAALEALEAPLYQQIGSTLHAAATYGASACTARLLSEGVPVDCLDKDGHTPLHLAAVDGDVDVIKLLLDAGAGPLARTRDLRGCLMSGALKLDAPGGRTALHLAAATGNVGAVEALFAACPEAALVEDLDGATPRDVALREGARSRQPTLAPFRVKISELLAPGEAIPAVAELLSLVQADLAVRRVRCTAAENAAKKEAAEKMTARGYPSDNGFVSQSPDLYDPSRAAGALAAALQPELAAALRLEDEESRSHSLRELCTEITPGVFAVRLFAPELAGANLGERLLKETRAIEVWASHTGWPVRRPNSMNRYGLVLADVGLSPVASAVATELIGPLAAALFPGRASGGAALGSDPHAFTVRYREGEDRHLDTHVDSSDVTLNLCLGGDFVGGGVYFHGLAGVGDGHEDAMMSPHPQDCSQCRATHRHEPGVALLHLGRHIHGAHSVSSGERTNLIVWCRDSHDPAGATSAGEGESA